MHDTKHEMRETDSEHSPGLKDKHSIWVPARDRSMNFTGFWLQQQYKIIYTF